MEDKSFKSYYKLCARAITALLVFSLLLVSSMIAAKNLYAQANDSDVPNDYKIGAEDVLHISVWENEHLNREVFVRPDGKISFPLVDDIDVNGLTAIEVKEIIAKKLTIEQLTDLLRVKLNG